MTMEKTFKCALCKLELPDSMRAMETIGICEDCEINGYEDEDPEDYLESDDDIEPIEGPEPEDPLDALDFPGMPGIGFNPNDERHPNLYFDDDEDL